jgi:probable HAF family extracellular repeat protein
MKQVIFLLVLFSGALGAEAQTYSVVDLGTLGGDSSEATDLNESGQVVGISTTSAGQKKAFLWHDGKMKNLGTLGGPTSHAARINDSGTVVGWSETPDGAVHACLFDGSNVLDLHIPRFKNSYASGINNSGLVVGHVATGETIFEPPIERPMAYQLSPLARSLEPGDPRPMWGSGALAVNNGANPRIVGWTGPFICNLTCQNNAAMAATGGKFTNYVSGGRQANAIDDSGNIVGVGDSLYFADRATLWLAGGDPVDLGAMGFETSAAHSINGRGQIVGVAHVYRRQTTINDGQEFFPLALSPRAFLWQDGGMVDLNDLIPTNSSWQLSEAAAISDAGQITGTGLHNGRTRAFLLSPNADGNRWPQVRLSAPTNGAVLSGTRSVSIVADAMDPDGAISRVEFFGRRVFRRYGQEGTRMIEAPPSIGLATRSPFTIVWSNLTAGTYVLLARATDSAGVSQYSQEIFFSLDLPPILLFPYRTAGGEFQFQIADGSEPSSVRNYRIESSADLMNWTPATNFTRLFVPGYVFGNRTPATDPQRFYRAIMTQF